MKFPLCIDVGILKANISRILSKTLCNDIVNDIREYISIDASKREHKNKLHK